MTLDAHYDVAVIGAGPAGLAAATMATRIGLATVLFDEQHEPGGQIYRSIGSTPLPERALLGDDYERGAALVDAFAASGCRYVPNALVWSVMPHENGAGPHEIAASVEGRAQLVCAKAVVLATGALERASPIPGWTLPGVMTAGAAQVLLKSSALVPRGSTVLAGSGPLLYLLAGQWIAAGVAIAAILDTTPQWRILRALPHALSFVASSYFGRGVKLVREVRSKVRVVSRAFALEAEGRDRVERIRYRSGHRHGAVNCDLLLLHQGVVPNVNLAGAIGCEHVWDDVQRCLRPRVDDWGASTVRGVFIAGDGAGIAGARAAEHSGSLAALAAGYALRAIDSVARDEHAAAHRNALARSTRPRRFFDVLYAPAREFRVPADDTVVCRCEEVTARQIRDAVALGCVGPNQLKAYVRCGMGPCQGRLCGLAVTEIIADTRGMPARSVGYYRLRFPVKPLTLGEIASLPQTEASRRAVVRLPD